MQNKVDHSKRNQITEHQNNYKLCNLYLIDCYSGLYPSSLTKLALVLFSSLLSTKKYYRPDSQYYSRDEDKRIYTNVPLNSSSILEKCHPVKYKFEGKNSTSDSSNIIKKINELDENNIFYNWKYGYPHVYMFVMERDIGLWKFYNPKAFVVPRTILKIIFCHKGMVQTMSSINNIENADEIEKVKISFCQFIDRLVEKMHPDVIVKVPRLNETICYKDYLLSVKKALDVLDPFEGLEEDENFYERLPSEVHNKLKGASKPIEINKELEKDLVPQESTLQEKKKRKRIPSEDTTAKIQKFMSVDPFQGARQLIQYYRALIKVKDIKAEFYSFETEVTLASEILDLLTKHDRKEKKFLSAWITFFIDNKLKGNNLYKKDKTSLEMFKSSFEEYNNHYIDA